MKTLENGDIMIEITVCASNIKWNSIDTNGDAVYTLLNKELWGTE